MLNNINLNAKGKIIQNTKQDEYYKLSVKCIHVYVHKENGFAKALKKYNFYFQRKEHYVFYLITNVHNLNTWSIHYACEYFVVQKVVNPIQSSIS